MKRNIKNKVFLFILFLGFVAEFTSAQDEVNVKDVNASAITFSDLLVGKRNAFVLQSGTAGNASLLMIRGINTINLNSSPVIYVDGIPMRYTRELPSFLSVYDPIRFGFVNPNDIKDLSLTSGDNQISSTGGRGANGAVFITTDRGELGGTKIDFIARIGLLSADYNYPVLGNNAYRSYLHDYMLENGMSQAEVDQNPIFNASLPAYSNQTDWLDLISRNALFNDYHLKLKGGDGDASYMFSVGYTNKEETLKESGLERLNMRFNIDYRLSQKIDISNSLSYSNMNNRYSEQGFNYGIHPIYVALTKAPFMNPNVYSESNQLTNQLADVDILGKSNPSALIHNLENKNEDNRVDGVIKANYNNGANSLHATFAFNYMNLKEKQYRPSLGIISDFNRIRQNMERSSSEFQIYWDSWVERFGKFGDQHTYKAQLGFSIDSREEKSTFIRKINAGTDDYETLSQGTTDSTSHIRFKSNLMSVYANGTFDFFNFFKIDANVNLEGSSNFGRKGRWGIYPGLKAVADLFNRDDFKKFALRAEWERTGNNDLRGYYQFNLYNQANYFGYGGVYLANVANENIKPEITDVFDGGVMISLFNQRLSVDAGYYYKRTFDLVTQRNMPIELGLDPQFENSGSIVSQGLELNVDLQLVHTDKFNWSVSGNFATLKNKVTKLYNGEIVRSLGGVKTIARENEAIGSFYGYKILGVFGSATDVNLMKPDGNFYKPGDYIVDDVNNDHKINEEDLQVIGSSLPDFFGGIGTKIGWKRLSLETWFSFSSGNDVYNRFDQQMNTMQDYSNQSSNVLNRWISESNRGNGLSRAALDDPSGNSSPSDLWIEDGSFFKLKNVTLSYDIPLGKIKAFNRVNVYFTGENLFVFTKYNGFDPEFVSSSDPMLRGIDFGGTSVPKSYILGVKFSF